MSKDNLNLWNSVCTTNPAKTKEVRAGGRKITSIIAQSQLKRATELFGSYGKGFGLKDINIEYINGLANNQVLATGRAVFYYPDGEFEIGSSVMVQSWNVTKSYNSVDSDFVKKLETDMTTKALSKLGFNADVFEGMHDDKKYVQSVREMYKKENTASVTGAGIKKSKKLTDEAFKTLVDRIKAGEKDLIRKYVDSNYLTDEQHIAIIALDGAA